jgi:uncharacterized membrane protein
MAHHEGACGMSGSGPAFGNRGGEFPDAEIITAYDKIEPGASKRLLRLYETEVEHRREMERLTLQAEIADLSAERKEARLGQVFAFLIGVVAILAGCYSAMHGSQIAGAFIGGGGVIGLVTVFIIGRRPMPEDIGRKMKVQE